MSSYYIEEGEVKSAIDRFFEGFGSEALLELISIRGRVLEVKFSGNIGYSCGVSNYFDDFAQVLEELSGTAYTVWDYKEGLNLEPYFLVRLIKLDFLGEIRRAIGEVGGLVKDRIMEFEGIGRDEDKLFKELCFCLLTANFTAEGGMRIQKAIGEGFLKLGGKELTEKLRELGYRYPEARAHYIVEARRLYGKLRKKVKSFKDGLEAREWLVGDVKGLGYKEASHFLRNTGFKDVAIIDRHIQRFLKSKELIEEVSGALNRDRYLQLEKLLSAIANRLELSLAELDLYLWYIMTGKILK
jgi:N-glycosylase/DNA lyase